MTGVRLSGVSDLFPCQGCPQSVNYVYFFRPVVIVLSLTVPDII